MNSQLKGVSNMRKAEESGNTLFYDHIFGFVSDNVIFLQPVGCVQSLSFASIAFAGKLNAVSVLFFSLLYILYMSNFKSNQHELGCDKNTEGHRLL